MVGIVSDSGQLPIDRGADLKHLGIRGGETPAQFKIQARGNVHPLSIGGELLQAGGDAVVSHVPLVPGGDPHAIKAKNEQPAGVPVVVVMGADVLKIHGVTACEVP